jgi:hypothetical protein
MTKLEIIQKVLVETYGAKPSLRARNKDNNGCLYTTEDGKRCAVGMCMTKKSQLEVGDYFGGVMGLSEKFSNDKDIDRLLQKKYHGHNLDFWKDMQYFHDNGDCFTETGLSKIGETRIELLKSKYK